MRNSITHPWLATTPGCPLDRHPTRDCRCKVFRTERAAQEYAVEQVGRCSNCTHGALQHPNDGPCMHWPRGAAERCSCAHLQSGGSR